jgi:integrase
VRITLKGIKRTTMRLADGSRVTYYYAWRGGPRLSGEPGSVEFHAAYNAAVADAKPKRGKTLAVILDAYRDSEAFRGLAPRTAKDYATHLGTIGRAFGDLPLTLLGDRRTRAKLLTWRDELARKSPRGADYLFAIFARALSWAFDRGLTSANPLEKPGRVWKGNRKDSVWGDVEEANMRAACSPALRLAMMLALWTAQRQGDILKLTWSAYDGTALRLRQGKTRKELIVPVGAPLKAELDATPRVGLYIVSHDGHPFTTDGFKTSWGRATERAGLKGLTFHDLRGTFATRAYECGATDAEVAAVTGHGADGQAHATLRRHYLQLNLALARECIRKLETRTGLANALANGIDGKTEKFR